jgi:hypothetical protein
MGLPIIKTGELAGDQTYVQGPTIGCDYAVLKALASNTGKVYVGFSSAVTVAGTTTNTTMGFELSAGEHMLFEVDNLNKIYYICDNDADDLCYMLVSAL